MYKQLLDKMFLAAGTVDVSMLTRSELAHFAMNTARMHELAKEKDPSPYNFHEVKFLIEDMYRLTELTDQRTYDRQVARANARPRRAYSAR